MSSFEGSSSRRGASPRVDVEHLEDVLRALREQLGVTQKEIADRAQVSPATIARLEAGDRRPSRAVLEQLAAVFATTVEGLVGAARELGRARSRGEELELPALLAALPPAAAPGASAELPRSTSLAAEHAWAGDPHRSPGGAALPPAPAPVQLTAAERQVRRAFELIEEASDRDRAAALLRQVAGWLAGAAADDLDAIATELDALGSRPTAGAEPVAAMPTGETRSVLVTAVGRDRDGRLWIDPLARARRGGYDDEDPRVERYDDGRLVLDVSRLADPTGFGPRNPARHRTLVQLGAGEGTGGGDDAQVYTDVVLELAGLGGDPLVVTSQPGGGTQGRFPDGVTHVHVLTASNPRSRLLRSSENAERNRLLGAELDAAGLRHIDVVVRSARSSWTEDGFAVIDADEAQLLALAARYEQTAVHRWTSAELAVVWVGADRDPVTGGWSSSG